MDGKDQFLCVAVLVMGFLAIPVVAGPTIDVCEQKVPYGGHALITCTSESQNTVSFFQGSQNIAMCSKRNDSCSLKNGTSGYIVASDTSVYKYFLTIPNMNGTYCGTYRCTDTSEEDSVQISYTDAHTITLNISKEPVASISGIVEFSTSCALSLQELKDITVKVWRNIGPYYTEVFQNMQGVSLTIENSTCTETCNEEYTSKIITKFVHNPARTENTVRGKYVVELTIPEKNLTLKASSLRGDYIFPGEDSEKPPVLHTWAIVLIIISGVLLLIAIVYFCYWCCQRYCCRGEDENHMTVRRGPEISTIFGDKH